METAYIPVRVLEDAEKGSYFRAAQTLFPTDANGNTVVMHRATVYNQDALWNDMKRWFDGGAAASGSIDPQGAAVQKLSDGGVDGRSGRRKKGRNRCHSHGRHLSLHSRPTR
jgi:hypothetical protein